MISERTQSSGAWTRNTDPDAAWREDFLRLLARLDLEPAKAIALVEAGTGQPFETCSPSQLVPLLRELLDLVRSHASLVDARQKCHV
jgi:hypothetical protein